MKLGLSFPERLPPDVHRELERLDTTVAAAFHVEHGEDDTHLGVTDILTLIDPNLWTTYTIDIAHGIIQTIDPTLVTSPHAFTLPAGTLGIDTTYVESPRDMAFLIQADAATGAADGTGRILLEAKGTEGGVGQSVATFYLIGYPVFGGSHAHITANTIDMTGAVGMSSTLAVDGAITIGLDTNLYRSAADVLKTDDFFQAGGATYGWGIGAATGIPRIYHSAGMFVFINASNADADLEAANAVFSGTLVRPYATNTADLGSSTYKWKNGYFTGTLEWGGGAAITSSGDVSQSGHTHAGADIASGTVDDARLSANVAKLNADLLASPTATYDLGGASNRYVDLHLSGAVYLYGLETTTSNDYPVVWSSGNTKLYYKTDGHDGSVSTAVTALTVERGIVTSVTGTSGYTGTLGVMHPNGTDEITMNFTSGLFTGVT